MKVPEGLYPDNLELTELFERGIEGIFVSEEMQSCGIGKLLLNYIKDKKDASLQSGKMGYTIALRTGPSMPECERIISSIEHFYGHLEIEACGKLGLCGIEYKENLANRQDEIKKFCEIIKK